MTERNWAENVKFGRQRVHTPETVEAVQALVREGRKVKVFGARHSFNAIADTSETHISLENLDQSVTFDEAAGTVSCNPGISYGELCPLLHARGVSLHNTASLPHITLGGATATGTHGSGDGNGNLATAVVGLEIVDGNGELRRLSRDGDPATFPGAVVGLGALGVVTRMTLATGPAFSMQQELYENLPVDALYTNFDEIMGAAYSVSLFTDWQKGLVGQVWLKRRLEDPAGQPMAQEFFGATPAATALHPVPRLDPSPCTPQLGQPGDWHERLPHFLVDHTPASGDELQTEYFVPRSQAVPALQAMEALRDQFADLLWISEIRTVAADDLWLSQSYDTPTVAIHFSWHKNWPALESLLPQVEEALAPFSVRPHWGKLFTLSPGDVQAAFSRMGDFRALLAQFDPDGKFRNDYLERYILGAR